MVVETYRKRQRRRGRRHLSVSSDGSWWLKLWNLVFSAFRSLTFSILGRIVVVETVILGILQEYRLCSFSILGRIVVVETVSFEFVQ